MYICLIKNFWYDFNKNSHKHDKKDSFLNLCFRYYGCGLVIPEKLEGMNILDLGSGSGRDCFALSKLVGPKGHVTGIDMTDEQVMNQI